jgi:hypothetical protein
MATSTDLTTLDFDSISENLKTYLKSQSIFKDYDFEGANIAVLIDLLSYNTYLNNFYLNMVGNEMFLDSALLRDSVVSHAKELNYLPRSFRSAFANVSLVITGSGTSPATISMPKGTSFSGKHGSNNYTFVTDQNYVLGNEGNTFYANNILIYEGDYNSDTFVTNDALANQRFILSNVRADTSSITISVVEDNGSTVVPYTVATSLFGLDSTSKVFFVQAAEDDKYEIVFGDGVTGRKPKDNSLIIADYRVSTGELSNGLKSFTSDGAIGGEADVEVVVNVAASAGSVSESLESIKFNAPRAFTTQERAVTSEDYENLLRANFAEVNEVVAYGGEEANPPQYGKVFVSVDLTNVDGLPDSKRAIYQEFLRSRSPLSIDSVFVDPEYLYVYVKSTVNYNINLTDSNEDDIKNFVQSAIVDFNSTNLNGFRKKLKYSKLVAAIDGADSSITSNDTEIYGMKIMTPSTTRYNDIDVDFGFELADDLSGIDLTHGVHTQQIVYSSTFSYKGNICILEDDGDGLMRIMAFRQNDHTVVEKNIGTVDYASGQVQLLNFKPESYSNEIKLYGRSSLKNIESVRNSILSIRPQDILINVNQIRE